jgi:hypothetical protein
MFHDDRQMNKSADVSKLSFQHFHVKIPNFAKADAKVRGR